MSSTAIITSKNKNKYVGNYVLGFSVSRIRTSRLKILWKFSALTLLVTLVGCASTRTFRSGQRAELQKDYDRAVVEYTRALQTRPNDRNLSLALERAKLRASEVHFNQGRRLAAVGKYQEALVEYRMASQLNPTSEGITEELRDVTQKIQTVVEVRNDGRTELEALIDRVGKLGPSDLNLLTDIKLPDSNLFSAFIKQSFSQRRYRYYFIT